MASRKLGDNAVKHGLTSQEQAVYKQSLGDLCTKLRTASRSASQASSQADSIDHHRSSSRASLGANAMKRGLTSKEQAIYNNSLGNLCAKLMNTSRSTLASKGSTLSVDRVSGKLQLLLCSNTKFDRFFPSSIHVLS